MAFENVVGKGGMLVTLLFHNVFYPSKKPNLNFSFTFILSSAIAFNLDQSKISLFGKELKECAKKPHPAPS